MAMRSAVFFVVIAIAMAASKVSGQRHAIPSDLLSS